MFATHAVVVTTFGMVQLVRLASVLTRLGLECVLVRNVVGELIFRRASADGRRDEVATLVIAFEFVHSRQGFGDSRRSLHSLFRADGTMNSHAVHVPGCEGVPRGLVARKEHWRRLVA